MVNNLFNTKYNKNYFINSYLNFVSIILKIEEMKEINFNYKLLLRDFPGGAVVKNLPANAGGHRFDLWSGKIPHAEEQLSLHATTTEPVRHNYSACVPRLLKPGCLQPVIHNRRTHCNEKPMHRNEE